MNLLKYTYQTKNPVLTIAGSGTAAAEMAMINTIPAGGTVLFLSNGKFAERWVKIGERNKWNATVLKAEYGTAVARASVEQVADALKAKHYDAVVLVHSETSACTVQDLAGIAALTRNTDTVLISDGITAIGSLPVKTDEWGVDIVITGSQKALMLPPGLAFLSVSEKAQKKAASVEAAESLPSISTATPKSYGGKLTFPSDSRRHPRHCGIVRSPQHDPAGRD